MGDTMTNREIFDRFSEIIMGFNIPDLQEIILNKKKLNKNSPIPGVGFRCYAGIGVEFIVGLQFSFCFCELSVMFSFKDSSFIVRDKNGVDFPLNKELLDQIGQTARQYQRREPWVEK